MLDDVTEFVSLARDGAYMYGDRRVSPTERSKWHLTFRSLATQAQSALHAAEAAEIGADLPPRARQVADERSRAQALIGAVVQSD